MSQTEKYLLTFYRYVELNPVRAGMVESREEYKWSSYAANAWAERSWIFPNPEYASLGNTPDARANAYRELFRGHLSKDELHNIRKATYYCQPLGDDRFAEFIKERYGVEVGVKHRGWPARTSAG